jgi:membrane protein DedA with SNARE-associated domain
VRDWIVSAVQSSGAWGVGLLMFAENVFPPIPSEIIMPLAGYLASQGQMNLWLAIVGGTIGSLAGVLLWYEVGRRLGDRGVKSWLARHGVWLTICPEDVDKACRFFERHDRASVFFGRLVPVVRTLISVPAGFAKMPIGVFLLFSSAGTLIWTALLAFGGQWLGSQFPQIGEVLGVVTWLVVGAAAVWYVVRVMQLRRRQSPSDDA